MPPVNNCNKKFADGFSNSGTTTVSNSQNQRERQRQISVNSAFVALRRLVPSHPPDKKMSKHEILVASIRYIRLLEDILDFMDKQERQK